MLTDEPSHSPESHRSDRVDRQRKITEVMIKSAIVVRSVVFFFLTAFFLNMVYLILVDPSVHSLARKKLGLIRTIVFSAVLLPALAIALLDARGQLRKYFGSKR